MCEATVDAVLSRVGDSPLAMSDTLIFLPNNRAIKSMTEAFVRHAKPGLLLPRMVAVGDLAIDEALGPIIDPLDSAALIHPVIEPMQRLMLLAKLVIKSGITKGDAISASEALRLARYLCNVIDELEIEGVDFGRFDSIKPDEDIASHWLSSFGQLLGILPEYYSEMVQRKSVGPAARRNQLLGQLSGNLKNAPPKYLVVAAGISTAAPAIAHLLKTIATLPNSMVILPALDVAMDDSAWSQLGPHDAVEGEVRIKPANENHPQFHLKLLLERMGFGRDEVGLIGEEHGPSSEIIRDIFCLPDATAAWMRLAPARKKLPHVRLLVAEDSAEEARAIAILLRGATEQPERRAALVTPDRELAMRVAAQLKRWDIVVDDSAGTPLLQTPEGKLLMALADAFADRFSPVSILAIAKHPLVHAGDDRIAWLDNVRQLDFVLRGPNEGVGLGAIAMRIEKSLSDHRKNEAITDGLPTFWRDLSQVLGALDAKPTLGFASTLQMLSECADSLTDGGIWRGATGRQLAKLVEHISTSDLSALGKPGREAVPAILKELFDGQVVRPPYGGHPRVAIYGLLEARLQQADLVICAGLNEGSWPQLPQPDPWLAPRIRRDLGLAALERNIGLSAHDLSTMLGAKEVILSRSKRDRGGPAVASRFLLRIQALLGEALTKETNAIDWARRLELPARYISVHKPQPAPTLSQRKVAMSVTDFDKLKADPYAFYANKIMRFRPLEPVDAEPGYAWRGTIIHDILEQWALNDACDPAKLAARADALLHNPAIHPELRALWQPRIADSLRWVAEQTQEMQAEGRCLLAAEAQGQIELGGVSIRGRADRIDRLADGNLAIVDYKTGQPPSNAALVSGFALQLGLIALMAQEGKVESVQGIASQFEYWSFTKRPKGDGFGQIKSATSTKSSDKKTPAMDFVDFVRAQAVESIGRWILGDEAFTAKLHPEFAAYADYDQLMRLQEWDGREPIDEGAVR